MTDDESTGDRDQTKRARRPTGDSRDGKKPTIAAGSQRLPTGPTERIMQLVVQSAPDPTRPRLPEPYEAALYETDRKRAAMYASMEDISDQFAVVAERITEMDNAVPVAVEHDEDSLVTTIDEIRPGR